MLRPIYHRTVDRIKRLPAYRKLKLRTLSAVERVFPPSDNGLPIPPPHMRQLTTLNRLDVKEHLEQGRETANTIVRHLRELEIDTTSMSPVLEFGCGCGRVLRHLPLMLPGVKLFGTDVDPELIDWAVQNLSSIATFQKNGYSPPTEFADESIGAIYAISVFTHLDEEAQLSWLSEFHRILEPGGAVLLTIVELTEEHKAKRPLEHVNPKGMAFEYRRVEHADRDWVSQETEFPGYIDAKNTVEYCQEEWSKLFEFCGFQRAANHSNQTLIVMRKRSSATGKDG